MKLSKEAITLQDRLGYTFKDPALLITALTHSSMSSAGRRHNERLEFLGDRVLGLVMAEALFDEDKAAAEGKLAPRFNALVRKETCADVARALHLGDAMKLGRSEMLSGGRRKNALLGDAMEALIAAVYRDGGFAAAQDMILRLWKDRINSVAEDARDAKTALQEWAQARKGPPPQYKVVDRSGPDHAPIFTIEASLHTGQSARAQAASKKAAEHEAAQKLLDEVSK
ncbi:MAG: ribonuclease III [Planktomarina sp.]